MHAGVQVPLRVVLSSTELGLFIFLLGPGQCDTRRTGASSIDNRWDWLLEGAAEKGEYLAGCGQEATLRS